MGITLLLSTAISLLIFLPLTFLFFRVIESSNQNMKNIIVGGAASSLVAVIAYLPFSYLYDTSTITSYTEVMKEKKDWAFFILAFFAIISEIVRWRSIADKRFFEGKYLGAILHGVGWSISELIVRYFLFFEGENDEFLDLTFLFLLIIIANSGLATILLRAEENTKFVMFAAFLKFFIELAIISAFGFDHEISEAFLRLYAIIGLEIILVYLTIITRKNK